MWRCETGSSKRLRSPRTLRVRSDPGRECRHRGVPVFDGLVDDTFTAHSASTRTHAGSPKHFAIFLRQFQRRHPEGIWTNGSIARFQCPSIELRYQSVDGRPVGPWRQVIQFEEGLPRLAVDAVAGRRVVGWLDQASDRKIVNGPMQGVNTVRRRISDVTNRDCGVCDPNMYDNTSALLLIPKPTRRRSMITDGRCKSGTSTAVALFPSPRRSERA